MALPVSKNTNYGLGVACIVFLLIAGYYGASVMSDMAAYSDWDKPAEGAKMVRGIVYGGVGFLLALGVNVFEILKPVLALIPGMDKFLPAQVDSVSDQKRAELSAPDHKAGV